MIPKLIEYDKIFKKKEIIQIKPIIKEISLTPIDTTNFLFNIACIIIIIIGIIFLIVRNENKEHNKVLYERQITQFYNKTN
jgi:hypothetical protein